MKIGIIREEKFPADKRVVFTPETCVKTVKRFPEIEFFIECVFSLYVNPKIKIL